MPLATHLAHIDFLDETVERLQESPGVCGRSRLIWSGSRRFLASSDGRVEVAAGRDGLGHDALPQRGAPGFRWSRLRQSCAQLHVPPLVLLLC
jgi:hypothetical protein